MGAEPLNCLSFSNAADREQFMSVQAALDPKAVRELLWKVFRLAVNGGLEAGVVNVTSQEVAVVFDQLIDLSELVSRLKVMEVSG